jgi:hypothetical protein
MRPMRVVRLSALWALSGAATGVVLWSVLGGTVWQLLAPTPSFGSVLRHLPLAILGSAMWAVVIGVVATPAYFVVFTIWQLVVRRWPHLEATPRRRTLAMLGLGAPPTLMLTYGFASGVEFDWQMAALIFPLALVSCWGGVWIPRRLVPALRAPFGAPAV